MESGFNSDVSDTSDDNSGGTLGGKVDKIETRTDESLTESLKDLVNTSDTTSSEYFELPKLDLKNIIIAYEPVWSIGTGQIPKSEELRKIFRFIKYEFKKKFNKKSYPVVLYGGSVNENNVKMLSSISEIDGFLIGGASQSPKKFIDIIKNYYK